MLFGGNDVKPCYWNLHCRFELCHVGTSSVISVQRLLLSTGLMAVITTNGSE